MAHYLITGGTGFLGRTLIKRIISGNKITVVARNEGKLLELKQQFPSIRILAGDISKPFVARQACHDINGVYHLAGFKHVGMAEKQTLECYETNVMGTFNILQAIDRESVDFIVGTSTDKACRVAGVYGASKLLMEGLFRQFEAVNKQTRFRIVRYGNVIYSTGSVLCRWRDLIKANRDLVITDPESTRFYWTASEAVELLLESVDAVTDCSPYVPAMKSIVLADLLSAMISKYNPAYTANVIVTGLQPGENKHEQIAHWLPASDVAQKYTVDEITQLI